LIRSERKKVEDRACESKIGSRNTRDLKLEEGAINSKQMIQHC
jgi:hypothetical protein